MCYWWVFKSARWVIDLSMPLEDRFSTLGRSKLTRNSEDISSSGTSSGRKMAGVIQAHWVFNGNKVTRTSPFSVDRREANKLLDHRLDHPNSKLMGNNPVHTMESIVLYTHWIGWNLVRRYWSLAETQLTEVHCWTAGPLMAHSEDWLSSSW